MKNKGSNQQRQASLKSVLAAFVSPLHLNFILHQSGSFTIQSTHSSVLKVAQINNNFFITTSSGNSLETTMAPEL
jgi:hypothetical protein